MTCFLDALEAVGLDIACVVLDDKRLDSAKDAETTSRRLNRSSTTGWKAGWAAATAYKGYIPSSDEAFVSVLRERRVRIGEVPMLFNLRVLIGVVVTACCLSVLSCWLAVTVQANGEADPVIAWEANNHVEGHPEGAFILSDDSDFALMPSPGWIQLSSMIVTETVDGTANAVHARVFNPDSFRTTVFGAGAGAMLVLLVYADANAVHLFPMFALLVL
jgi:hypothetical protein